MSALSLVIVALSTLITFLLSVRVGAFTLAAGLLLLALLVHLQRGSRTPWRSPSGDLATLITLALATATLAILLP